MASEFNDRLTHLEESNRQMKAVFVICLCGVIPFALMGAGQTAPIIEVQKIILKRCVR